ncbi:MAG: hypothetical protein PHQ01_03815, partial [Candidatus Pacebacteria bacterium]|nr:hypothetical protein [Candidatus Paceibacterota bacterium]
MHKNFAPLERSFIDVSISKDEFSFYYIHADSDDEVRHDAREALIIIAGLEKKLSRAIKQKNLLSEEEVERLKS